MDAFKKLLEGLDVAISGMDTLMKEDPDSIFTEGQIDEQIFENAQKYFEDMDYNVDRWTPEMKESFESQLDALIEQADPELFTEKNIVRLDRQTVFNQLVGLFSLIIARRRKDPVFALYKKGSMIRRKAKQKIREKYASRAVAISRKYLKGRKFRS
jgi:hypothetical protein